MATSAAVASTEFISFAIEIGFLVGCKVSTLTRSLSKRQTWPKPLEPLSQLRFTIPIPHLAVCRVMPLRASYTFVPVLPTAVSTTVTDRHYLQRFVLPCRYWPILYTVVCSTVTDQLYLQRSVPPCCYGSALHTKV